MAVKPLKPLSKGMGLYQVFYRPQQAPDKSKPWAVVNLRTHDINGRWHATKEEALAQARAIYARLGDKAKVQSEMHNAFFCFADDVTVPEDGLTYLEAIEAKTYHTPAYGSVEITDQKIQNFIKNFHDGVRGQEIAINYEHGIDAAKGNKAAGWLRDAVIKGNKLMLGIEFTEPAKAELKNKEWKYFSLEWDDEWLHPDGVNVEDVIIGGALTNRPVAKNLMPINFSEIFVERAEVDDKTDDDEVVTDESKEWEHSEPGTGSPPRPRTDEDGSDDPAIGGGWRRDTPPIADPSSPSYDPDSIPDSKARKMSEGGKAVPFELRDNVAHELLRVLDLPVDAGDEQVLDATKKKFGELTDLRNAVEAEDQERKFAEKYPQYWQEHNALMERDRMHTARMFGESVQKIYKTEGHGLRETKMGLSSLARDKVEEVHRKFGERTVTVEDFEAAVKAITNGGILEFGELGSGTDDDIPDIDLQSATGVAGARRYFAEVVNKIQREKPELEYMQAVEEAARKHPDLAAAYRVTLPA